MTTKHNDHKERNHKNGKAKYLSRRKVEAYRSVEYEKCDDDRDYDHPPYNPRYPDPHIYGDYASKNPPLYVPHSLQHICFKPRPEDYKPPAACDDYGGEGCVRRDHRNLTTDQQNRFLNAFSQLNAMGLLGPLVDIHANATHQMHGNPRFLPWHRVYLLRMEELLQSIDPSVCIPYWKSSEEQGFPPWLLGFTPTVNLMTGPHVVTRNISAFSLLPDAGAVTTAMSNGSYNAFAPALEGIHNSGHVWVGGSMASIPTAPADPVFWMHHCEIDRIWAKWQADHPGQNPNLVGSAAVMDPWTETEEDTRDIMALGYSYA